MRLTASKPARQNGERSTLKRMPDAGDRYGFGEVLEMGSLWTLPLGAFRTPN